ncbi:hypothetical protein G6F65_020663 [Rhizopus arrhizus]|nr:hypothetical protein G6F65_020663 [Rhizopus arrhizus]
MPDRRQSKLAVHALVLLIAARLAADHDVLVGGLGFGRIEQRIDTGVVIQRNGHDIGAFAAADRHDGFVFRHQRDGAEFRSIQLVQRGQQFRIRGVGTLADRSPFALAALFDEFFYFHEFGSPDYGYQAGRPHGPDSRRVSRYTHQPRQSTGLEQNAISPVSGLLRLTAGIPAAPGVPYLNGICRGT